MKFSLAPLLRLLDVKLLKLLGVTFAIILAFNLAIISYFNRNMIFLKDMVVSVYDKPLMASTYAMSAKYRFERVDALLRTAVFESDPAQLKMIKKEILSEVEQGGEDLGVVAERTNSPKSQKLVAEVEAKISDYKSAIDQCLKSSEELPIGPQRFQNAYLLLQAYRKVEARNFIQKKLVELTDDALETGYALRSDSELKSKNAVTFAIVASLVLLLGTLLLGAVLLRMIAVPLAKYAKVCLEVSAGNYELRVPVFGSKTEIASLGIAFNSMVSKINEKDRNMSALLDGLKTGVFSFLPTGEILQEKSKACSVLFPDYEFSTVANFFRTFAGIDESFVQESIGLFWNPDIEIGFEETVEAIFPKIMTLPVGSANPVQYLSLALRPNLNEAGQLEKIIVLIEDLTEATVSEANSRKQAERVERITKASSNLEGYLESKASNLSLLLEIEKVFGQRLDRLGPADLAHLKRQLHSLKGDLGMMSHLQCASLAHELESMLMDELTPQALARADRLLKSLRLGFLEESADLQSVLGIDETSKAMKINIEKIREFYEFVNSSELFSKSQKDQLNIHLLNLLRQPLSTFYRKYEQYTREVAAKLGKKVKLQFNPANDDVLFSEVQAMDSVFGHLVRNSIDHGIEPVETRIEKAKDPTGQIVVSVARSGDRRHLEIRLSDDGQGINVEKVRSKAIEKNLLTASAAADLTKSQAMQLIFRENFSTQEAATETSGRGVGLDAVRDKVESLGGSIRINEDFAKGTEFVILLPVSETLRI